MLLRFSKKNKILAITTLFLSISYLILFCNIKISFVAASNNSLITPLNFPILEFSDKKGTINNISSIDIELPSSTWYITQIEMNFTNIEYYMDNINTVEDIASEDDLFLDKHGLEGLAVQIKLNLTTTIYGAYIKINIKEPHALDNIYVQITGYNSSINAPNDIVYGQVDLNYTIANGWNYQNFTSPIKLPKGNYFLVMGGNVHAGGQYHWYYNNTNPNNPDLYISENHGFGWINGIQGSPFLYKLAQKVKEKDIFPETYNMTAEINGESYKILNGTHNGSGYLKLSDIYFSPNAEILHIPIKTNRFFFNLSYYTKLKNQFLSDAFVIITEEDNFWKILPDISRVKYNYSIKIQLPNSWYNLAVFKDTIDITSSEDIVINGNFLHILNDTINDGANWEITVKSPKIDFLIELIGGNEFKVGDILKFSVTAPIRDGKLTFRLYNGFGAEMDNKTISVTSDKTLYSYHISSDDPPGNWTAYIYWNNLYNAGMQSQIFTIKSQATSDHDIPSNDGLYPLIIGLGLAVIIGAGSLTTYQLVKRKKRRSELKLKRVSNKFKDILSLNYLMISDIKSGVNVYEKFYMGKSMDPSLISGFLDAIRNFGIELTGAYRKSETVSLDYEDSIILMNESKDFRLIIIMSDKPSEEFTNSITNLAKDIEEKYGVLIREFKGGQITQFAGISELIEMHLNVSFASPLRIAITKKAKFNAIEKAVIEKAKEIMKQTNLNYFYSTFLMTDQKFNHETTKVIFDLINRKIFQPINLNLKE